MVATAMYRMCGTTLASNVPLPELPRSERGPAETTFRLLPAREFERSPVPWFHHWRLDDGRSWLAVARTRSGYLLRFAELADFLVLEGGREIRCSPAPGTPPETIRHLLLDQVVPLVLSHREKLVLHASGVASPRGAVAFLGQSGWGKSTLAATFCRAGLALLADDCLLLERRGGLLLASPSYPGLRLWPAADSPLFEVDAAHARVAHDSEKRRLGPEADGLVFCAEPRPLRRIYLLAPPEATCGTTAVGISPLSPQEGLLALVKYAYRLDIGDRRRLGTEFERLGEVAASCVLRRLAFPRDFSLLPAVREAVLRDASGLL